MSEYTKSQLEAINKVEVLLFERRKKIRSPLEDKIKEIELMQDSAIKKLESLLQSRIGINK